MFDNVWLLIKYLVLGLVQGFTEPIPVSSSGHLIIVEHLFGIHMEGLSFEVLVNTASLLAIMFIYRQDLIKLVGNTIGFILRRDPALKSDFMFAVYLVIGTIPAGIAGVLFKDWIGETFKGLLTIGITLLVTGVSLWFIRNLRGRKSEQGLTLKDALIIGLAQMVALIPGISRSGSTIVAGMAQGLKQDTALKFSFFLYIPVSLGGIVLEGKDMINDPDMSTLWLPYLIAFIASLVTSYYALRWFMGIMARGNLKYFSYYCYIVGTLVVIYSFL